MAKAENKYLVSFKALKEKIWKEEIPNNILISTGEKILFDEILKIICLRFVGKEFNEKMNLISFSADEKAIENILNECSNTGLFSEKKVVVIKNVKKFLKNEKLAVIDYLKRPNSDTCLVMETSGEEFNPSKIFLYDTKDGNEFAVVNKNTVESNVKIYEISQLSETELIEWIKNRFEDYKISENTIKHFLQFSNYSPDEIYTEIEKLKTYCFQTREVTIDAVNLCNGIAKDFNESDFIKAVIERDNEKAYEIYNSISLKKDVEVFLVFLLNSSFIAISKLFDPAAKGMNDWDIKRTLKLWFPDQDKLIPLYKKFRDSSDTERVSKVINHIFNTDKMLKTSGGNKKNIMAELIYNICNT